LLVSLFVYTYISLLLFTTILVSRAKVNDSYIFDDELFINCSVLTLDKGKKPTNHENLGEIFRHDRVDGRVNDDDDDSEKYNNDPRRKSGRPKEEMAHDFHRGLKTQNIIIYPVELNVFPLRPSSRRSIVKYLRRVLQKKKNHPEMC